MARTQIDARALVGMLFLGLLAGCATDDHHATAWGYEGDLGPSHWGDLSPEYHLAKTGKEQSPVDIRSAQKQDLPEIAFHYRPAPIDLVFNGHTIQQNETGTSSIEIEGQEYVLQQYHFHSPSEHTRDGRHADMEMHLVHANAGGELAVVGVLIEAGDRNSAFDPIWAHLPTDRDPARTAAVTVNVGDLLRTDRGYFRYPGSLTTPPCTEQVLWLVLRSPVELSESRIEEFRAVIHGNNRPVQPLNGRRVVSSR